MGRHYRVAPVMKALAELGRLHPDLLILTHVMVGFPGETREDFRSTLGLIRSFEFDGIAPDCYSPRPGARAAEMDGQIPLLRRKWRYLRTYGAIIRRIYLRPFG